MCFFKCRLREWVVLAKRYIEFPKYSLPGSIIDTSNSQLPTLMIASFYLSSEVGFYAMAGSLLTIPASVISEAVMNVFRQRANEEMDKTGNCRKYITKFVSDDVFLLCFRHAFSNDYLPDPFFILTSEKTGVLPEFMQES